MQVPWQVTANDDCCRVHLPLIADTGNSGARVAWELGARVRACGKPVWIVGDNGSGFTGKATLNCANGRGIERNFIDPGNRCRMDCARLTRIRPRHDLAS